MEATRLCTVDGCDRPQYVSTSTFCSKHYQRWRKHGTTDRKTTLGLPIAERFMHYVRPAASGCWEWTARIDHDGYGRFGWAAPGRQYQSMHAHRAGYMILVGPVADDLHVDHLCRNRLTGADS
jgi:hypothetical protein